MIPSAEKRTSTVSETPIRSHLPLVKYHPGKNGVRFIVPGDTCSREGGLPCLPEGFENADYRPSGGTAELGRGGVFLLEWPDGRRCYYRSFRHGGLFAPILADRYCSDAPLKREIEDSQRLLKTGVKVPIPILGRVERKGLFVKLALVTEQVPGQSLIAVLQEDGPASIEVLREVGRAIARMHAAGFRHHDLHPGNILISKHGAVVILDLEGGRWGGEKADGSALKSLVRMGRYMHKHGRRGEAPELRLVLALLEGYEERREERRILYRRLESLYRRELRWHRLSWLLGYGSPGRGANSPRGLL